ncbi:hypothetical protein M3J09_004328 [Ascochyta lentis]
MKTQVLPQYQSLSPTRHHCACLGAPIVLGNSRGARTVLPIVSGAYTKPTHPPRTFDCALRQFWRYVSSNSAIPYNKGPPDSTPARVIKESSWQRMVHMRWRYGE